MRRSLITTALLLLSLTAVSAGQTIDTMDVLSTAEEVVGYEKISDRSPRDVFATADDVAVFYSNPDAVMDTIGVYEDFIYRKYGVVSGDEVIYSLGEKDDLMEVYIAELKNAESEEHRCVILTYHRFEPFPRNAYEVSPAVFDQQMAYIAENGYTVISLDQLLEAIYLQDPDLLPENSVVITVDDGFRCFLTRAVPILQKYGFTATLFVYTAYVNAGGRSLTWDELRLVESMGFSVECHSYTHPNFNNFKKYGSIKGSYNQFAYHELLDSKKLIEKNLEKKVKFFCWPYGELNDYAMHLAIKCGYESTVTVKGGAVGLKSNPLYLNRFGVYSKTTMETFKKRLEGKIIYQYEEDKGTYFSDKYYGITTHFYKFSEELPPAADIDALWDAIFEEEETDLSPAEGEVPPGFEGELILE